MPINLVREDEVDNKIFKFEFQVKGGKYQEWTTLIKAPSEDHDAIKKARARFENSGFQTRVIAATE